MKAPMSDDQRDRLAAILAEVRTEGALQALREIGEAAKILERYDCTEDYVPPSVDVPDDYEKGVHDAARSVFGDLVLIRSTLAGSEVDQ